MQALACLRVKDEPEVTENLSLIPISAYNKTKMISEEFYKLQR